jgi:hypothetical protein
MAKVDKNTLRIESHLRQWKSEVAQLQQHRNAHMPHIQRKIDHYQDLINHYQYLLLSVETSPAGAVYDEGLTFEQTAGVAV